MSFTVVPYFRLEIAARVITEFAREHGVNTYGGLDAEYLAHTFRSRGDCEWAPRQLIHKIWIRDRLKTGGKRPLCNVEIFDGDYKGSPEFSAELSRRVLEATGGKWEESVKRHEVSDASLQSACDAINQYLEEHGVGEELFLNPAAVRTAWEESKYGQSSMWEIGSGEIKSISLLNTRFIHGGEVVVVYPTAGFNDETRWMSTDLRRRFFKATDDKWDEPIFEDESLNSPS
jgi:hypothetical protein